MGRSYGLESGCFGKKFPGIFFSDIWSALEQEKTVPISAWITDIGNDLGYEVPVETIVEWILGCIDRLQKLDAKVALMGLPLAPLSRLSERKFRFLRTLFFPTSRIQRDALLARASELHNRLEEIAKSRNIPIITVPTAWYGWDPIHPRRRHFATLWREMLGHFVRQEVAAAHAQFSWPLSCYLRMLQPKSWSQFSVSRSVSQPNGRLLDGTTIAIY